MPVIDLTANELGRLRLMRAAVERLHREMNNAGGVAEYWLSALDEIIGIANGETKRADRVAPDGEFIEVPVTRRARVTLVSREQLRAGDRFVLRPALGASFRQGVAVAREGNCGDVSHYIPTAQPSDMVYRVEPE